SPGAGARLDRLGVRYRREELSSGDRSVRAVGAGRGDRGDLSGAWRPAPRPRRGRGELRGLPNGDPRARTEAVERLTPLRSLSGARPGRPRTPPRGRRGVGGPGGPSGPLGLRPSSPNTPPVPAW